MTPRTLRRRGVLFLVALLGLLLAVPLPAVAAEPCDGGLLSAGAGQGGAPTLTYHQISKGVEETRAPLLVLEPDGGSRRLSVVHADGGRIVLGRFPAEGGNPLVLMVLERVVRDMAGLAHGNPHYVRSHLRDALRTLEVDGSAPPGKTAGDLTDPLTGATVAGCRLRLRPFADDPHRDRMGAFADLDLEADLSPAVPGGVLRLSAEAGDYLQRVMLTEDEEADR